MNWIWNLFPGELAARRVDASRRRDARRGGAAHHQQIKMCTKPTFLKSISGMKQKTYRVTLVNWIWNLFPGELAARRVDASRRRDARRGGAAHHQQIKMCTKPTFLKSISGMKQKTYRVTLVNWIWNLFPGELAVAPRGIFPYVPMGV